MNTAKQARQLLDAAAWSWIICKPLNYFITISLQKAGLRSPLPCRVIILKKMGDWCRSNTGSAPLFIWQMENPVHYDNEDRRLGGLNMHLLVYVPLSLGGALREEFAEWIVLAGGKMKTGVLDVRFLEGAEEPFDFPFVRSLLRTSRYVVKGSSSATCTDLGIEFHGQRDQGKIVGKRCGISQSLSKSKWAFPQIATSRRGLYVAGPESRRRRILAHMGHDILAGHPTWLSDA